MTTLILRPIASAPATELAALQSEAFSDFQPSAELAAVIAAEAAARPGSRRVDVQDTFGVAAFRDEVLVGWSQGYREGQNQFYMLSSGVAASQRRQGVYSLMVKALLEHAHGHGYSVVRSRHTAANTAVIIAKLRLGFQVSGFEYSEVFGPLVQLSYLVSDERRRFYQVRATPGASCMTPDRGPRSSGAQTAGRQARSGRTRDIWISPGLTRSGRRPFGSNALNHG